MKNLLKNTLAVLAISALLASCNDDNTILSNTSGNGNLDIEFDNSYAGNELELNAANTATSNNEILNISAVKYFISNIVLTDENGATFSYPKANGYFIVDESDESSVVLHLENIPAANYSKIRFGIGVDPEMAASAEQAGLIALAQNGRLYDNSDYAFLSLKGNFTSPAVSPQNPFEIQVRQTTTAANNYHEVTLDLPQKALVRTEITPEIHVVADLSKIIDGTHKVKLSDHVEAGEVHISEGETIDNIALNLPEIFTVAHVHND